MARRPADDSAPHPVLGHCDHAELGLQMATSREIGTNNIDPSLSGAEKIPKPSCRTDCFVKGCHIAKMLTGILALIFSNFYLNYKI